MVTGKLFHKSTIRLKNENLKTSVLKRPFKTRGVLPEVWVGVCGALLETLTLFQTMECPFPYPIPDLTQNLIPYFRPDAKPYFVCVNI